MASVRQEKVGSLVRKELSMIFQQEARGLLQGAMVSVTVVRMSPDLSSAKVFLSIFAPGAKKDYLEIIRNHTSQIRKELGSRVRHQLRIVPNLHWVVDDSLDYAERIDELLG